MAARRDGVRRTAGGRVAPKNGTRWCSRAKRNATYARDSYTCLVCGADLLNGINPKTGLRYTPSDITLDHLEPRLGGKVKRCADGRSINDPTNLITCCRSCNCSRKDRPWREFCPGGAIARIEAQVKVPLNMALAQALLANQAALVADVETR